MFRLRPIKTCVDWVSRRQLVDRLFPLVLLMCLAPAMSDAEAGKFNKVLSIGDAAPEWKGLRGVDGKQHSLADLKDAKLVIVVFTCNHCPVARSYEDRLIQLAKDWKPKQVEFVAISVSRLEADNFEAMKQRAKERDYPFPYLQDLTQKTARSFGALCTPHVFVLDQKRRIVSMGRIDDSLHPDRVEERFLNNAIAASLKGETPDPAETKPSGCPIDYADD